MKSKKVLKQRLNLTINKDLNSRWSRVSELTGMSKSQMVENFLQGSLPILEKLDLENVLVESSKIMGQTLLDYSDSIRSIKK